ncbi:MAG: class I SAM-dependent methyltransferase [Lautropia sp.]
MNRQDDPHDAAPATVAGHYRRADLVTAIEAAIAAAGKTTGTITAAELAPLDEFHIGGRAATAELLRALAPAPDDHVLDVGCGLGGAARFAASSYRCRVTGIDLTDDYVAAGSAISRWLGVDERVKLLQADALDLPFGDATFDGACLLHAGMNIRDKTRLFAEVARVLRPGARLAVYDVMRTQDGELQYPLPWADTPVQSALATPEQYRAALAAAGLDPIAESDRRGLALEHFARQRAAARQGGERPPIGLHVLMGARRDAQVGNMSAAIEHGRVAPYLMIARKAPAGRQAFRQSRESLL